MTSGTHKTRTPRNPAWLIPTAPVSELRAAVPAGDLKGGESGAGRELTGWFAKA
jgi:hypothetical protein